MFSDTADQRPASMRFISGAFALLALAGAVAPSVRASGQTSSTTLAVSAASVSAGTVTTLTATVTGASVPITVGQVIFCDATAAFCDGTAVFGVASITSTHTAVLKLRLGAGAYSIKAVFRGIGGTTGSTSAAQPVTVSAASPNGYASFTTIASSGSVGNYTLTGTVATFGKAAPTGTVSFLDTSNGNASVASAPLNPATRIATFVPAVGSPLTGQLAVQWVVAADFNNDGIPDLAVANRNNNGTIAVYLGVGDGTFLPPTTVNAGGFPVSFTVADVNGDGIPDLLVPNQTSPGVAVRLGNGDGTFAAQTIYATGNNPRAIAVGDFNRDGVLDLAVVNGVDNTVSILLGNGDGTFQTQTTVSVGSFPSGVVAGDFNNDGFLDLAVTNGNSVSILLGQGNGTFAAATTVALPVSANGGFLTTGDLRKNGTLDLIVPDFGSTNVYVLLGNNDGTFQSAVAYPVADVPQAASVGDVDGDGIPDLVVADTGADGLVSVLYGKGDGTFAAKIDYTVGNNPENAALADFNGDGLLDLATANLSASTTTILLQQITETATATGIGISGGGTHNVLTSYPGDATHSSSQSSTVALTGNPLTVTTTALGASPNPSTFGQSVTFTATVSPAPTGAPLGSVNFFSGTTLLGSGTVNSSGVATFSSSALSAGVNSITAVYSGNAGFAGSTSAALFEVVHPTTTTTTTLAASAATVTAGTSVTLTATVKNGNTPVTSGTITFCDASATRCEDLAILGNSQLNAGGTAVLKLTLGVGTYSVKAMFAGRNDLLPSTSAAQSLTVTGNASYPSVTTLSASGSTGNYTLAATVAAFGRNALSGNISFLDTSNSNAVAATAPLNGSKPVYNFTAAPGSPLAEDNGPFNVVAVDLNGDGILDLAVVDNNNPSVSIYLGNGDGTFQDAVTYAIDDFGIDIKVADLNGDGKLDIVTANNGTSGTVSVLLGNGDGTFQASKVFSAGTSPEAVSVADFNNDGIPDLAVANDFGTPGISILIGNGDGTFKPQVQYQDAGGPFFTATGDFNGDGIVDLATADINSGTVAVFLGNGDGTFKAPVSYLAGNSPDYIVAVDLNKDGKLDLVAANFDDDTISVFIGKGDGTFQSQVNYDTGSGPNDIAIGDFDGDGKIDLAISDDNDTTISILYGNGDGTFQGPVISDVAGNGPWGIAVGDFNGDGLTDLVVTNNLDSTVTLLLNQQIVTATATGVSILGAGTHNVLASYPGDASRAASQSPTVPLNGTPPAPTVTTLTASPNPAFAGQSVTLTASIAPVPTGSPLGNVNFFNGATQIGTVAVTAGGTLTFSITTLAVGDNSLTAVYTGNLGFTTSTSAPVTETINPAYTVTAPTSTFTVGQGGSAVVTVDVPPVGGAFNNVVTMSASGLPAGATAIFNPATVTPGALGGSTMLTIQLRQLPTTSSLPTPPQQYPFLPATTALAFALLAIAHRRSTTKVATRAFLCSTLLLLAVFLSACNGGFASKPGTIPGKYIVTITGTSGTLHPSTTITITVQ